MFYFPSVKLVARICKKIPVSSHKLCLVPYLCRTYVVKPYKPQETIFRNYDNSFQLWVLNLFKNDSNYSTLDFQKSNSDLTDFDPSCMELDTLLNFLWEMKAQEALTPLLLRKIDAACCTKITPKTSSEDLLKCLQVFTMSVPVQITKMESFRNAVFQLENKIRKSKLSPHEVVQGMYYASHMKNGMVAKRFMQVAVYHMDLEKMEKLNAIDLGIFCVSLFRCGVPIDQEQILKFLDTRFRSEIPTLVSDHPAIFVSFIKCFRLSKYYEEDLLDCVVGQGLDKMCKMDITAKIHLAVWFAASEYGNAEFVRAFLSACVKEVSTRISENAAPRLKDFDNLFWSAATYGFPEISNDIQRSIIPEYVGSRLCLARNDPHLQISLLLWLWMCECRQERDVTRCVVPETIRYIKDSKHFKSIGNLFLLMTCAEVERPGLLKANILSSRDYRLQPKVPQYLEKRPQLKELLSILHKHSEDLKLSNVRFSFQIHSLYVGGISAEYQGKPFSIEVLDPTVCLSDSQFMKGRMRLKLRLLDKMGLPVLKVAVTDSFNVDSFEQRLTQLFPTDQIQG